MNQEINKFIADTADSICKATEKEVEQNLLASIIDIYENDYTFKEYRDKLYKYNKDVKMHNYKLSIMNTELAVLEFMTEVPVLSYENFMFIRSLRGDKHE